MINKYIEVYEYPDGRIELRANGMIFDHQRYIDYPKSITVQWSSINAYLSHVLQAAQLLQAQRDNRPASGSPSRSNQGIAPNQKKRQAGTKKQREFTAENLTVAVMHIEAKRCSENTLRLVQSNFFTFNFLHSCLYFIIMMANLPLI